MKRRYIYFLVAFLALSAVSYPVVYSYYTGTVSNPNGFTCPPLLPCDNTQPPSETCSGFCVVDIQDSSFNPPSINVTAGTTVEWVNLDSFPHTSTADNASVWDSFLILPGGHFTFNFSSVAPGTYNYHCNVHPFMLGSVTVLPSNKT